MVWPWLAPQRDDQGLLTPGGERRYTAGRALMGFGQGLLSQQRGESWGAAAGRGIGMAGSAMDAARERIEKDVQQAREDTMREEFLQMAANEPDPDRARAFRMMGHGDRSFAGGMMIEMMRQRGQASRQQEGREFTRENMETSHGYRLEDARLAREIEEIRQRPEREREAELRQLVTGMSQDPNRGPEEQAHWALVSQLDKGQLGQALLMDRQAETSAEANRRNREARATAEQTKADDAIRRAREKEIAVGGAREQVREETDQEYQLGQLAAAVDLAQAGDSRGLEYLRQTYPDLTLRGVEDLPPELLQMVQAYNRRKSMEVIRRRAMWGPGGLMNPDAAAGGEQEPVPPSQ